MAPTTTMMPGTGIWTAPGCGRASRATAASASGEKPPKPPVKCTPECKDQPGTSGHVRRGQVRGVLRRRGRQDLDARRPRGVGLGRPAHGHVRGQHVRLHGPRDPRVLQVEHPQHVAQDPVLRLRHDLQGRRGARGRHVGLRRVVVGRVGRRDLQDKVAVAGEHVWVEEESGNNYDFTLPNAGDSKNFSCPPAPTTSSSR